MGKGIPAALLGAATKSHFLRALSDLMVLSKDGKLPEPKEIVMLAHAELVRHLIDLDSFVTLCYARLDVSRCSLDLVDCGHTGIVHLHGKTGLHEILHGDNLPLGVREGEIYDQISVPFEPGDLFFFYSDGITEARNPTGELFGPQRLEECVVSNGQLEPARVGGSHSQAVATFTGSDTANRRPDQRGNPSGRKAAPHRAAGDGDRQRSQATPAGARIRARLLPQSSWSAAGRR